jgi:hypothetical protein
VPWASFTDVPQVLWRMFLQFFEVELDAVLDAHPSSRRSRAPGGSSADAATAAATVAASGGGDGIMGMRGTQLVTRGGTRIEAFGTSCPSAWLAERQVRRTGGSGHGW